MQGGKPQLEEKKGTGVAREVRGGEVRKGSSADHIEIEMEVLKREFQPQAARVEVDGGIVASGRK